MVLSAAGRLRRLDTRAIWNVSVARSFVGESDCSFNKMAELLDARYFAFGLPQTSAILPFPVDLTPVRDYPNLLGVELGL